VAHITTIGLDIAKHIFHAHGADAAGQVLLRKRLTRAKLLGTMRVKVWRSAPDRRCAFPSG
jgi:hypothetical protein